MSTDRGACGSREGSHGERRGRRWSTRATECHNVARGYRRSSPHNATPRALTRLAHSPPASAPSLSRPSEFAAPWRPDCHPGRPPEAAPCILAIQSALAAGVAPGGGWPQPGAASGRNGWLSKARTSGDPCRPRLTALLPLCERGYILPSSYHSGSTGAGGWAAEEPLQRATKRAPSALPVLPLPPCVEGRETRAGSREAQVDAAAAEAWCGEVEHALGQACHLTLRGAPVRAPFLLRDALFPSPPGPLAARTRRASLGSGGDRVLRLAFGAAVNALWRCIFGSTVFGVRSK